MRVLVITQFFQPDITAAAFRMADMCQLLVEADVEVKVIAGEPHKVNPATGGDLGPADPLCEVVRCHVAPLVGHRTSAYVRHYLSFVSSSVRAGFSLWRKGWRPDVIYASSPPLFVGVSGQILSYLFWRPVVLEIRDVWPDTAVAAGQLARDGKAYVVGRWLERFLYRHARQITCVASPMRRYIESQCAVPVTVIYNGVRLQHVPDAVTESSSNDRKTLLYAGNIGHLQNLGFAIRGFVEWARERHISDWRFRIVGEGSRSNELRQLVDELKAERFVELVPAVPREVINTEMVSADALYLGLVESDVLKYTIPSKLFDYLAAGRPIVASLQGEGREILQRTNANICFSPSDAAGLKNALDTLVKDIKELQRESVKNRELVLRDFTRAAATRRLIQVFQQVSSS
jgi:glycosyltransferase involved in cell wall biosynthesis